MLGAELTIPIANRLGLSAQDTDTLAGMVRHHLLLPITATRSDLNDPKTIESVAAALRGDPQLLELLHALAEADSKATGPGVWSDWKASLIEDLVRRCRLVMAGEPLPEAEPVAPHYLSLAADRGCMWRSTPATGSG